MPANILIRLKLRAPAIEAAIIDIRNRLTRRRVP
jgi:hypothetical protein